MPKRVTSPLDVRPIDPFAYPAGEQAVCYPEFATEEETAQDSVTAAGGRAIQPLLHHTRWASEYKAIYKQGDHHLLLVPKGDNDPHSQQARIFDIERNSLSGPMNRAAIIAQGYWEPYTGNQGILARYGL